jgi:Asp-tRNA(Asn)/Glu-tRNA(Gln) amidotransferase A subunit family amidase
MDVAIAHETPLQDDVRKLVADLNAVMMPLTPREFQFQLTAEQMAEPSVTVFVARDGQELTGAYLAAIDAANPQFNTYVSVTHDKAREMADASDARLARGEGGALEGIPLGIKDLFGTEGVHTQACSHVLDGFKPRYESTVTANLWADGAVMLGKLNMDEFAMGSSNETSHFGAVANRLAPGQ